MSSFPSVCLNVIRNNIKSLFVFRFRGVFHSRYRYISCAAGNANYKIRFVAVFFPAAPPPPEKFMPRQLFVKMEDFLFVCALKFVVILLLVSLLFAQPFIGGMKGRKLICSNRLYFVRCCKWINSMLADDKIKVFLVLLLALFPLDRSRIAHAMGAEMAFCLLLKKQEGFRYRCEDV